MPSEGDAGFQVPPAGLGGGHDRPRRTTLLVLAAEARKDRDDDSSGRPCIPPTDTSPATRREETQAPYRPASRSQVFTRCSLGSCAREHTPRPAAFSATALLTCPPVLVAFCLVLESCGLTFWPSISESGGSWMTRSSSFKPLTICTVAPSSSPDRHWNNVRNVVHFRPCPPAFLRAGR